MRLVLVTALAVACTAPPDELPFGEVDGSVFLTLDEDLEDAFSERVLLAGIPRARLTPTGSVLAEPRWRGRNLPLVVVDPGPWPRVGLDVEGFRLLAYVDRERLQRRIVGDVSGPVRLPRGTPVEVVDEDDGTLRAQARFAGWTARTWVPRAAIDEVWSVDDEAPVEPVPPEGEELALRAGAEVWDLPEGEIVAQFDGTRGSGGFALDVVQTDEAEGEWVPVAFVADGVRVDGWASEEDLAVRPLGFGFGCGCGGSFSSSMQVESYLGPTARVPAGTLLRTESGGPVVAMATRDHRVPLAALDVGAVLSRDSRLGRVDLWVEAWDVVPR